ncbi:MAG: TOMM precursor leader peptide-binding protein [Chloroflexota bacterium]
MRFLKQPLRLKPHIKALTIPENPGIFILSAKASTFLEGAIPQSILPHIDGQLTGQQIVDVLRPEHSPFAVIESLLELVNLGSVEEVPATETHEAIVAMASALGIEDLPQKLTPVALHPIGHVDGEQLQKRLHAVGIKEAQSDSAMGLDIFLTDSYFRPELAQHNEDATRPWLPICPFDDQGWIGPLVVPGETACWACFYQRLSRNFEAQHLWWSQHQDDAPLPAPGIPLLAETTLNMAAQLIVRWLLQPDDHPLLNQLLTFDSITLTTKQHRVVKRPQCSVCGSGRLPEQQPVILNSQPATGSNESGHRLVSAESMLAEYGNHIDPITGIVPRLRAQTDDGVTHVYGTHYVKSRLATSWKQLSARKYNGAGGKGASGMQAKASALGEAIERYASLWDGTESHIVARWDELPGRAYRPQALMLFSDAQYANRKQLNEIHQDYKTHVPHLYDPKEPIAWVKVWSLSKQEWVFLPAAFVYFDYHGPGSASACVGDSNGNAAGTSIEDAILQGFYELIERDSVALWWYNRLPRPGVNLDGVNDGYISALRGHYAQINRTVWVLDITSDFGIPAYVALSRRVDGGPQQITAGFGAHMDSKIAIIRALTEMNQLMPSALKGAERIDRRLPEPGDALTLFDVTVADHPYLFPSPSLAEVGWADSKTSVHDDLRSEVEYCHSLVKERGMEMLVLDLTRPDLKLPVVKVTVPGMRHFWRRLAPGRLYDVPVQMGWSDKPTIESNVNPIQLTV